MPCYSDHMGRSRFKPKVRNNNGDGAWFMANFSDYENGAKPTPAEVLNNRFEDWCSLQSRLDREHMDLKTVRDWMRYATINYYGCRYNLSRTINYSSPYIDHVLSGSKPMTQSFLDAIGLEFSDEQDRVHYKRKQG